MYRYDSPKTYRKHIYSSSSELSYMYESSIIYVSPMHYYSTIYVSPIYIYLYIYRESNELSYMTSIAKSGALGRWHEAVLYMFARAPVIVRP